MALLIYKNTKNNQLSQLIIQRKSISIPPIFKTVADLKPHIPSVE